jgi:hypothetical protein
MGGGEEGIPVEVGGEAGGCLKWFVEEESGSSGSGPDGPWVRRG